MLSASAILINETGRLDVNQAQRKGLRDESLQTFRANVSYSFAATVTPSVQYFRTTGPRNLIAWGTPDGSPNTDGVLYEIAYSPWGKPGSPPPIPGLNARLTLQYTDYFSFDGTRVRARSNNVTFMGLQTGLAF